MKTILCRAADAVRAVACAEVGNRYDLSLALYPNADTDEPICSHSAKGSSRHPIWWIMTFVGGMAFACSLIGAMCACCHMKK